MPQGDPQLPDSVILGQFNGLKNTVASERLTGADLERALNIDLDDAGQASRRRGYSLKSAGNWHSLTEIGGKVYAVKDGTLGIVRPDYSFKSLTAAGNDRISFTMVGDDTFFSSPDVSGVISAEEVLSPWGATNGQGTWLSPVLTPTETLGAIGGKLLGDPPKATSIAAYKGRIYLAQGKTLWATELYQYHYVDKTKNFMQFEHDISLLMAMDDGLYVGTSGGLYFIKGVLGSFQLSIITSDAVLPGSEVWVPADLVHPSAMQGPMPTGYAAVMMTNGGVVAGFDGGNCYNLTHTRYIFPSGQSAAGLFRQDQGANTYVAAVDSAGGPSANARIGDYVDAEIRRFQGG